MSATVESTHDIAIKLDIKNKAWPDSGVHVVGLQGEEGMSMLFEFQLEVYLTTQVPRGDMADLLGQDAVITFTDASAVQGADLVRYRNGIVRDVYYGGSFVDKNSGATIHVYSVSVVPAAYKQLLRGNCKVFVGHKLANVFNAVCLSGALLGKSDYTLKLSTDLQKLGWCGGLRNESPEMGFRVQYRETNWDFLSRLLEEYGVFYRFTHDQHGEQHLVISDRRDGYGEDEGFTPGSLGYGESLRSRRVVLRDFNPRNVDPMAAASAPDDKLRLVEYPGGFRVKGADADGVKLGENLAKVRLDQARASARQGQGKSVDIRALPGGLFSASAGVPGDFVLTHVRHQASMSGATADFTSGKVQYQNSFQCLPNDTQESPADPLFRPPRITPKPSVRGVQTATVLGGAGVADGHPDLDQAGRVMIKFNWDAGTQVNNKLEHASCRVRVSQLVAQRMGADRGAMWYPRVGDEVIVDFIEGDPDQPIVIGCVATPTLKSGLAYTPHGLENASATITGLRVDTSSSKDVMEPLLQQDIAVANQYRDVLKAGANEISLVDAETSPSLLLMQARDSTNHDATLITSADEHRALSNSFCQQVTGAYYQQVGSGQVTAVTGNQGLTVDGDQLVEITGDQKIKVTGSVLIECSGQKVEMSPSTKKVYTLPNSPGTPTKTSEESEDGLNKKSSLNASSRSSSKTEVIGEDTSASAKASKITAKATADASLMSASATGKASLFAPSASAMVGFQPAASANIGKCKFDFVMGLSGSVFIGATLSTYLGAKTVITAGLLNMALKANVFDITLSLSVLKYSRDSGITLKKRGLFKSEVAAEVKKSGALMDTIIAKSLKGVAVIEEIQAAVARRKVAMENSKIKVFI